MAAKAVGGALGNFVDAALDRARVAEQMGEGMAAAATTTAPNAGMMAATMRAEGAAELGMRGMFEPEPAGAVTAASAAVLPPGVPQGFAQMDAVMLRQQRSASVLGAEIDFTASVNLALGEGAGAADALERLHEATQQRVQGAVLRSRTKLAKPERDAVQNLLVVLLDQLGTIERLQRAAGPREAAVVWGSTLKHCKVGGGGQVAAEIGGVSHAVDFESAKTISTESQLLIRTQLTRECAANYFRARAKGKVFCAQGPAGCGKTETIKDLEHGLGVAPVVISVSDSISIVDELARLPDGSAVVLDEFNRLSADAMADAFRLHREKRLIMSITYNPGYAGRTRLPLELLKQCVVQQMIPPTADPALQLALHRGMLVKQGFTQFEQLAPKFGALIMAARAQCSKQPHYDFGLRVQHNALRLAGRWLAQDPSLDEAELLARSIFEPMWAKANDADRVVMGTLIRDIFGITPTVPSSWRVPGPQGKAAMMRSALESRHGGMMLVDRLGPTAVTLAALQAEAATFQAELIVVDYDPDWEDRFAQQLRDAAASGRRIWLTTDMTRLPFHEQWGYGVPPAFFEGLNSLLDDNKLFKARGGETIQIGHPDTRILFVAPPSVVDVMSPAVVSRLGIVDGTGVYAGGDLLAHL
eukprot:SAG31_NODE_633_length_13382_cov_11.528911_1_plen_643_part_00